MFLRPKNIFTKKHYSTILNLKVGTEASIVKHITSSDVQNFIKISGDSNPIHTKDTGAIVHGAYLNSLVSNVIGTQLPGPGTLIVRQTLNFPNKCYVNDVVCVSVRLEEIRKIILVSFTCTVEATKIVLYGDAKLMLDK